MALGTLDVSGKRKRGIAEQSRPVKKLASHAAVNGLQKSRGNQHSSKSASTTAATNGAAAKANHTTEDFHLQLVTGSYERVLHGISARIPRSQLSQSPQTLNDPEVTFSNSFLFAAHASAIRCLAISPETDEASKRYLATGSSDERINVYSLSTVPPSKNASNPILPSLDGTTTAENPLNRSLGSLVHHDRAITALEFPTRSKLFSAAEDATIAISRTRDWTVLSSIKAPIPKPQGRPSGDTAGPGEIPAGVNDFAIHPSQKLMLSVGRGERCMRLWNLMTGKKAGVLNFDRQLLAQAGEGKFGSGEGRKVLWDDAGENYVVGFERGAAVFGMDSKPKATIKPTPSTKLHQMRSLKVDGVDGTILACSTEDGRVLFYDLDAVGDATDDKSLPQMNCRAQLGGHAAGIAGRVKDFEIVPGPVPGLWIAITASSDGAIRVWKLYAADFQSSPEKITAQIGALIATHDTGNRITCLGAFVLDGKASQVASKPEEAIAAEEEEREEDDSDDSDGQP